MWGRGGRRFGLAVEGFQAGVGGRGDLSGGARRWPARPISAGTVMVHWPLAEGLAGGPALAGERRKQIQDGGAYGGARMCSSGVSKLCPSFRNLVSALARLILGSRCFEAISGGRAESNPPHRTTRSKA